MTVFLSFNNSLLSLTNKQGEQDVGAVGIVAESPQRGGWWVDGLGADSPATA